MLVPDWLEKYKGIIVETSSHSSRGTLDLFFVLGQVSLSVLKTVILKNFDCNFSFRATKCDELAAQPVEESTNWLPEEANKVRLLLKVCFYSKEVQSNNVPGLFLLETLVQSATQAPPIPISTCFVLNLAIQVRNMLYLKI